MKFAHQTAPKADQSLRPSRVVHVTESFGGGVLGAIHDYRRHAPGMAHELVYATRADAPVELRELAGFSKVTALPAGHIKRVNFLRRYLAGSRDAVVHAHSSYAGAYVRLAMRASRARPIIYTPHCYGFERKDISPPTRAAYWFAESVLAFNTTVFAGCSPREVALSRWRFSTASQVLLPNVAPHFTVPSTRFGQEGSVRIVGAGRLSKQKDPAFFAQAVNALRAGGVDVDATWIGGGNADDVKMLGRAGIDVTGWLPRESVLTEMAAADVYMHTAKWDGFPLTVLEAADLGLAIVVRRTPAFYGLNLPVEIVDPEDIVGKWSLLSSPVDRASVAADARRSLSIFSPAQQIGALRSIYGRVVADSGTKA